jgi:hypothetical protein
MRFRSSDPWALDRRDGIERDEAIVEGLAQGGAKHDASLSDRGGRQSSLLHPDENRSDVTRSELGDL